MFVVSKNVYTSICLIFIYDKELEINEITSPLTKWWFWDV